MYSSIILTLVSLSPKTEEDRLRMTSSGVPSGLVSRLTPPTMNCWYTGLGDFYQCFRTSNLMFNNKM